MDNPFSWDYLTTVPGPNEVFGPFSIVYLVIFVTGLAGSIVVYNGWARKSFKDPVRYRMLRRWSGWAIAICSVGLFFFLIRWLQINPFGFGQRIWMWLSLAALAALVLYAIYDYRRHYAELRAQYQSSQLRQQYLQQGAAVAAKRPAPTGVRPRPVRRRAR